MKKIFFLILIIAFAIIGCKKNFPIPKQPAEISPNALLIGALSATASNNVTNYLGLTRWMGYWAQYPYFPPDLQAETYNITNSYADSEWQKLYFNLNTYDLLEKTGRSNGSPFYMGVAKLMKAYNFSILVDMYNSVPYKKAFNADTKNDPPYDDAQSIYNDLVAQLDSAFNLFENARTYYKTQSTIIAINDELSDIVFGATNGKTSGYNERLTLWEKLTNTVELKLLMHQSNVASSNSFIKSEMAVITSGARKSAGFIGPGESVTVQPRNSNSSGTTGYILFDYCNARQVTDTLGLSFWTLQYYFTANAYADNFYNKTSTDIRSGYYYNEFQYFILDQGLLPEPGGPPWLEFFGYPYEQWEFYNDTNFIVCHIEQGFNSHKLPELSDTFPINYKGGVNYDGDPKPAYFEIFADELNIDTVDFHRGEIPCFQKDIFIFSDFESLFLQAEAVQRGYMNGNTQTLYESAISRNFICLGNNKGLAVSDALNQAAIYLSQNIPDIGWAASPNKLEAIMTQKWAAMNGVNWVEAYNDYRRTGYPTSDVLGISHAPTHVRPQIPTRLLYPQSQINTNPNVPPLPDGQYSKVFWNQ